MKYGADRISRLLSVLVWVFVELLDQLARRRVSYLIAAEYEAIFSSSGLLILQVPLPFITFSLFLLPFPTPHRHSTGSELDVDGGEELGLQVFSYIFELNQNILRLCVGALAMLPVEFRDELAEFHQIRRSIRSKDVLVELQLRPMRIFD